MGASGLRASCVWWVCAGQAGGAGRAPHGHAQVRGVRLHFSASATNVPCVADAIYVPTGEGSFYLALVLDVFSRCMIGWAMSNHLYTELMLRALDVAVSVT